MLTNLLTMTTPLDPSTATASNNNNDVVEIHLVYQWFQIMKEEMETSPVVAEGATTATSAAAEQQQQQEEHEKMKKDHQLRLLRLRQEEYNFCLLHHLYDHRHITKVHLLLRNVQDLHALKAVLSNDYKQHQQDGRGRERNLRDAQNRLQPSILGKQMKYSDAMSYINEQIFGNNNVASNNRSQQQQQQRKLIKKRKVIAIILKSADVYLGNIDSIINNFDIMWGYNKNKCTIDNPLPILSLTCHEHSLCNTSRNFCPNGSSSSPSSSWCGCPLFMNQGGQQDDQSYYAGCSRHHDSFWIGGTSDGGGEATDTNKDDDSASRYYFPYTKQVIQNCEHIQSNRWGADGSSEHKVINELCQAKNYVVLNPSLSIITYHYHNNKGDNKSNSNNSDNSRYDHIPLPPTTLDFEL